MPIKYKGSNGCLANTSTTVITTTLGPCASGPCGNGGTCLPSGSGFSCACPTGVSGTRCEIGTPILYFIF